MKLVLTGATGLLGKEILINLKNNYEIIPLSLNGENNTIKCDIREEGSVLKIIKEFRPELIIHSAAITDVDLCEDDPDLAHQVNTIGTRNLAYYASEIRSIFIYISTDYVFNGDKASLYSEEDAPQPINIYGISKLGGEKYVSYFMEKYIIFRTSLLYGRGESNFILKLVKNLKGGKEVSIVSDEFVSPTYSYDFVQGLKEFLNQILKAPRKRRPSIYGIYHLVNLGDCSKYDFALEIASVLKLDVTKIKKVESKQLLRKAPRPKYSALSTQKFEKFTGYKMRPWQDALKECLLNFMR